MTEGLQSERMIFILEDDAELLEEIRILADAARMGVVAARSMEEGVAQARVYGPKVFLAVIDLMIPPTMKAFDELCGLLREREMRVLGKSALRRIGEFSDKELADANTELGVIDRQIQTRIDLQGGAKVLHTIVGENLLPNATFVGFSATSEPTDKGYTDLRATLRASGRWIGWWSKPIDPDDLLTLLDQFSPR